MGKVTFGKVRELITAKRILLQLSKRFAKCFVWSVLLCVSEIWTIRKIKEEHLETFEMSVEKNGEYNVVG